jgi:IS1 family transposase
MDDGYAAVMHNLKGELHVISKRYTQRIERHNLITGSIWQAWAHFTVVLIICGAATNNIYYFP